jgi:hypothetical protein
MWVCGLARELDRSPRQAEMRRKTRPAAMGTGDTLFGVQRLCDFVPPGYGGLCMSHAAVPGSRAVGHLDGALGRTLDAI